MRACYALGLLLAISTPSLAWAAMPNDDCEKSELGATKLSEDDKNVIACLKTDDGKSQIWKAMTNNDDESNKLQCTSLAIGYAPVINIRCFNPTTGALCQAYPISNSDKTKWGCFRLTGYTLNGAKGVVQCGAAVLGTGGTSVNTHIVDTCINTTTGEVCRHDNGNGIGVISPWDCRKAEVINAK